MDLHLILVALVLLLLLVVIFLYCEHIELEVPVEIPPIQPKVITRADNINPYQIELPKEQHANDPQNVHDPQIVHSLSKKYRRLLELVSTELDFGLVEAGFSPEELYKARNEETIRQIGEYAKTKLDSAGLEKLARVLAVISQGNTVSSLSDELVREDDVLTLVWKRINQPANQDSAETLRETLLQQLINCVEKNHQMVEIMLAFFQQNLGNGMVVCVGGRVAQIISTLTMLDTDPILAEPEKDKTEITNIAYMRAGVILKEALKDQQMEKLYTSEPISLTASEKTQLLNFEKDIKSKIRDTLKSELANTINQRILDEIIDKAVEAI